MSKLKVFLVRFILGLKYICLMILTTTLFRKNRTDNHQVIMVFRTCLLGDFLFAIPSLNILRQRFPNAKIIFLTTYTSSSATKKMADKYLDTSLPLPWFDFITPGLVDEVISISNFRIRTIWEFRKQIKKDNPDLFFLLPHPGDSLISILKKIILFKLIGINKNFYGWRVKGDYSFFRSTQQKMGYYGHKILGPLRAIEEYRLIGKGNKNIIDFPLQISPQANVWAEQLLQKIEKGSLKIGLSIGSIQEHKRWPVNNFFELSKQLDNMFSVSFFLIGTINDVELSKGFHHYHYRNTLTDLISKTNIQQLGALCKKLDLVISNDGGAAHLAAAVGCKVVSIIPGIEYPYSIDPWGNFNYSVRHNTSCTPCYSMTFCPLGHNACMNDLSIESVLGKINLAINDSKYKNFKFRIHFKPHLARPSF